MVHGDSQQDEKELAEYMKANWVVYPVEQVKKDLAGTDCYPT